MNTEWKNHQNAMRSLSKLATDLERMAQQYRYVVVNQKSLDSIKNQIRRFVEADTKAMKKRLGRE